MLLRFTLKISLLLFTAAILLFLSGCHFTHQVKIKSSIGAALSPECDKATAREALDVIGKAIPDLGLLQYRIGKFNFTSFLLSLTEDSPLDGGEYEWNLEFNIASLSEYLHRHLTAVALKDISNLEWESVQADVVEGEFRVSTPYGLNTSFLFVAKKLHRRYLVTKLVIKKKNSSKVDDGYVVFEI